MFCYEHEIIELAEKCLNDLDRLQKELKEINKTISDFSKSDFHEFEITLCHPLIIENHVKLLDEILGDNIASYYFYEASLMKDGGFIEDNGVKYPIRSVKDVITYAMRIK